MSFSDLSASEQDALLNGPALAPPNGVQPNFENPSNLNAGAFAVVSICLALTTACIALRIWARVLIVKKIEVEDFLAFAGYGVYIGIIYTLYRLTLKIGFYVHQWDVQFKDLSEHLYVIHLCTSFYSVVMMTWKMAILLEWVHVFVPKGTRNPFFWSCHFLLMINVLFYSSTIIVANLLCHPLEYVWNKTLDGTCLDGRVVDVVTTAINLGLDSMILLLPQPIIWKIHVSKKKRLGISAIFTIGTLAVISSAFRLSTAMQYSHTNDATYLSSTVILWSLAEMTCVALVLCAPVSMKVWKESKQLSNLGRTLRSWTNLPTTRSKTSSGQKTSSWQSSNHKQPQSTIRYQYTIEAPALPLANLHSTHSTSTIGAGPSSENVHGILRTDEVTSRFDENSEEARADMHMRIHPWMRQDT
ncbi:hypothetical protein F4810DRAFT_699997 [Camillea tinctor]|nr:hypothetical protein F4810DRAFT_699997 [Camillea tinctor]